MTGRGSFTRSLRGNTNGNGNLQPEVITQSSRTCRRARGGARGQARGVASRSGSSRPRQAPSCRRETPVDDQPANLAQIQGQARRSSESPRRSQNPGRAISSRQRSPLGDHPASSARQQGQASRRANSPCRQGQDAGESRQRAGTPSGQSTSELSWEDSEDVVSYNSGSSRTQEYEEVNASTRKRRLHREAVESGQKLPRYVRPKVVVEGVSDTQYEQYYNALDREMRWEVLLTHTNHGVENVIDNITRGTLSHDSDQFGRLRQKASDQVRQYKKNTLNAVIAHVEVILNETPMFQEVSAETFSSEIAKTFNCQNYFDIFTYMKGRLDFERTSALGKFYLQSIFMNLGCRARKFVLAGKTMDDRKAFGIFYDLLPTRNEYDTVSRTDFAVRREAMRNEKAKKRPDMSILNDDFVHPLGPPPPKEVPAPEFDGEGENADISAFTVGEY